MDNKECILNDLCPGIKDIECGNCKLFENKKLNEYLQRRKLRIKDDNNPASFLDLGIVFLILFIYFLILCRKKLGGY